MMPIRTVANERHGSKEVMQQQQNKKRLKVNPNSISLAGEFAVLSQLALRGYDANMTLGRTKGVDILVCDPRTKKMFQLEVKTGVRNIHEKPIQTKLFGKAVADWIMTAKHEKIHHPTLFYCFVLIHEHTNAFRFFIVPSRLVADYVRETHRYWLDQDLKHRDNDMRLFRIGLPDETYAIPTPTIKYEDNWTFQL